MYKAGLGILNSPTYLKKASLETISKWNQVAELECTCKNYITNLPMSDYWLVILNIATYFNHLLCKFSPTKQSHSNCTNQARRRMSPSHCLTDLHMHSILLVTYIHLKYYNSTHIYKYRAGPE